MGLGLETSHAPLATELERSTALATTECNGEVWQNMLNPAREFSAPWLHLRAVDLGFLKPSANRNAY